MALEDKDKDKDKKAKQHPGGQRGQSDGAEVGKQTRVDQESSSEGGYGTASEGGGGSAAPAAAPAPAAPGGAKGKGGSAGKITVQSEKSAKGATESTAKFGVGEKATFSAEEEGTFRLDDGEIGRGQSVDWTAPSTLALRNLVFEPYLTSPNKDKRSSLPVMVVQPSTVDFKKVGDVPATGPNMAGVGMTLQVSIGPDSVSFGNAEWLEKPGPAEGVSGYFAAYVASGQSLAHPPNPNWLPMGDDNKAIMDNAWTRDKPKLKHPDGTMRWWAGSFSWSIPNVYRVKGVGGEHLITNVTQTFTMDDKGAITVTKGAASATARPDNQMDGEIQKFTKLEEAKTFLQPHGRAGCVQAVMNYKRNPKADKPSVEFLLAALKSFDVTFYVAITCSNTFSWTDPDTVKVSANGKPATGGERKINTGKVGEFEFQVNSILNLATLGTDPINISAIVSDITSTHPHSASLSYPYSAKGVAMEGSDRYTYSAFFK
ncbi:MAG: hypothetical protein IPQ07_09260 [Myxococcales bacterium]|nr:hypothetical protein [Myxococcales bacterium]